MTARRGRPLRLVLVIGSARVGGAETQLVGLAALLRERGVDVRVWFAFDGGPLTASLDASGVRWQVLGSPSIPTRPLRLLVVALRMVWLQLRWQPDVVFPWLADVVWLTLPIAAAVTRASRFAAVRGQESIRLIVGPLRYAMRHADVVTINAPALEGEALRWGARPDRIRVVPNAVELPAQDTLADVSASPPTAVVVANFRRVKGHDVLLDALRRVETPMTVRLLGAGDPELRAEVAARAAELGLDGWVQLASEPADVSAELSAAQLAIHPSRSEGLSNAILEELAAGLPVVATDVGGTRLLVDDGVNGYVVPAGDEAALARRIDELAASPALRTSMSAAARARAGEFDWATCTTRYLELFDEARSGGRSLTRARPGR